jgi:thermolysin
MGWRALASCAAVLAAGVLVAAQPPQNPPARRAGVVAATSQNRALLRSWDGTIDSLRRNGDLTLVRSRADTVLRGRTHERYQQYVNGLRIVGGEVTRQTAGGVTTSIFGSLYDVAGVPDQPQISQDRAREILRTLSTREIPASRPIELVVFPTGNGTYALAYSTHVWTTGGWMQVYLDAQDGRVLQQYNDLHTQAAVGRGTGVLGDTKKISAQARSGRYVADDALRPPVLVTYDMQGNLSRTENYLDGVYSPGDADVASDSDNNWTDGANVDAHVYVGLTYDYYFKRFDRKGLDDRNTPIFSITHPVRRNDIDSLSDDEIDTYLLNAFWCSGCGPSFDGAMVFGEGLPGGYTLGGQTVDYFAGALDVVAHELTHGLTDYSSGLTYRDESGALNESFSDMLGTSVEFMYQQPGSGTQKADYLIGEDIFRPGGLRSMANPRLFGDPDHYSQRYTGTDDNGGVHTNSGIPNNAFYLAIEGGTNSTSRLTVAGVGGGNRAQIEKAFYRAFTFMLPSNATFSTARAATIQAAADLYGPDSPAARAITQAWTAVGVN